MHRIQVSCLVKTELEAHQDQQAEVLRALADKLSIKKSKGTSGLIMELEEAPSPSSPALGNGEVDFGQYANVYLTNRHLTIVSTFDEWYGSGIHNNQPIPGGIAALEGLYQARWRKHFSPSQAKALSRTRLIVKGVTNAIEMGEESEIETMDRLEELWAGEMNRSPSKMVSFLQKEGHLTVEKKKPKSTIREERIGTVEI